MRALRFGRSAVAILAGSAMTVSMTAVVVAGATAPAGAAPPHPSAPVQAFPSPGDRVASPQTGITFRGVSPAALRRLVVTGSESGAHAGHVSALAAGRGSVFQPATSFRPGERVTVRTGGVDVRDATDGSFSFGVARPADVPATVPDETATTTPARTSAAAPTCKPTAHVYNSRPDLHPPPVCVIARRGSTAPGDLFLTPGGEAGVGPGIYDNSGQPVWFRRGNAQVVHDFQVVHLNGQEMLAYYAGNRAPTDAGHGAGQYTLLNDHYGFAAHIGAGNGLQADFHELSITKQGTALLGIYDPVMMNLGHGPQIVLDYVVQEVDFQHGNKVLFEWHALDHVSVAQSHTPAPAPGGQYDWFHGNSIAQDNDGNLLVSARNTWIVYKINRSTGKVIWELGQPNNASPQFRLTGSNFGYFCYQHDARVTSDGRYTVYDDGGGGPGCSHPARGLVFRLDVANKVATLAKGFRHSPDLFTNFTGSMRLQSNGDALIDWADASQVSEFGPSGDLRLDLKFDQLSYRGVRAVWHGVSDRPPDMVVQTPSGHPTAYVSWNGETGVTQWRLLGGSSPSTLKALGAPVRKTGFETAIPVPSGTAVVAVQGLNAAGNPLTNGVSAAEPGSRFFHETSGGPSYLRSNYRMAVGDFDGNTAEDILAYTPDRGPDYLQIADGHGGWQQRPLPQIAHNWTPLVGNFTGDARDEIIWWSPLSTTAYLARAPFGAAWRAITVPPVRHALVLRHNAARGGPNNDEVLWWGPHTDTDQIDHYTWPVGGSPSVSRLPVGVSNDYKPVTGDFDGNGFADVLWYGPGGIPDSVWYLTGPAHGQTTGHVAKPLTLRGASYRPVVGRFGAPDQLDDVLFTTPGGGVDWLWRGRPDRTFDSTNVTNGESGLIRVLHTGDSDAVAFWSPGHDLRMLRFATGGTTIRYARNTVVPANSGIFIGAFAGTGDDVYWYSPGAAPERLWEPVLD
jgi:hypothetical protein